MYILIDLIKYFAKFPDRPGVLKLFSRTTERITGYDTLKNYITALPAALNPEIKDFIVSTDETVVSQRIRNAASFFMLLEYAGLASTAPNRAYIRESAFNLSVIIAHTNNKPGYDIVEEQLIMDQALETVTKIAKQMEVDNQDMCSNRRFMPGSVSIQPIEPAMLYGCIGWSLTMTKSEPLFNEA